MITEIDYGDRAQTCPVCGTQANINSKQRQEFKEMVVDKYTFICSNCAQLWFTIAIASPPNITLRKFLPVNDLCDLRELFPDEQWQIAEFWFWEMDNVLEKIPCSESEEDWRWAGIVLLDELKEKYNV